jgi:hypothetical protein
MAVMLAERPAGRILRETCVFTTVFAAGRAGRPAGRHGHLEGVVAHVHAPSVQCLAFAVGEALRQKEFRRW